MHDYDKYHFLILGIYPFLTFLEIGKQILEINVRHATKIFFAKINSISVYCPKHSTVFVKNSQIKKKLNKLSRCTYKKSILMASVFLKVQSTLQMFC